MRFRCQHCGRELRAAATHAGKRARCPQCKKIVTVPAAPTERTVAKARPAAHAGSTLKPTLQDSLLFDAPSAATPAAPPAAEPQSAEEAYQRLRGLHGGRLMEAEEVPQRRHPWFVDIFLYPMNKSGLTILAVSAGIPLLLRALLRLTMIFCAVFAPALIFWVLLIMLHWAALALFVLYMNWYVCECIRDSATGGIRAADTTATTPGFTEILWQSLAVMITAGACMVPAILYLGRTQSFDKIFWALYAFGGFLFPMALLSVVMHESLRGLNPVLLTRSALKTLVPYSALVLFGYILFVSIPMAARYLLHAWVLQYVFLFAAFYQLLILAHLIGRFYWRHEERLYWDT